MKLLDKLVQDWVREQVKPEPCQGYGPLYPSVWIKPDKDPARGWWVTLAFDAEDEGQALCKFESEAVKLAKLWREDIARGNGYFTCYECLEEGGHCERCDSQGCFDQEGLSVYPAPPKISSMKRLIRQGPPVSWGGPVTLDTVGWICTLADGRQGQGRTEEEALKYATGQAVV